MTIFPIYFNLATSCYTYTGKASRKRGKKGEQKSRYSLLNLVPYSYSRCPYISFTVKKERHQKVSKARPLFSRLVVEKPKDL
jgi:hypothetical protein